MVRSRPLYSSRPFHLEYPAWVAVLVGVGCATARAEVAAITGVYDSTTVQFEVELTASAPFSEGWHFQLFIDSDHDANSGYGHGFESLVRGVELADVRHVYLRSTAGGGGPGGWGPALTRVPFTTDGRHLAFEVPVGDEFGIGPGSFRYAFESYLDGAIQSNVGEECTVAASDSAAEPNAPCSEMPPDADETADPSQPGNNVASAGSSQRLCGLGAGLIFILVPVVTAARIYPSNPSRKAIQ